MNKYLPTAPEVIREGIVVLAGAVLAAYVVGMVPQLKAWMQKQWEGAPH